jgi:hypothetical protein
MGPVETTRRAMKKLSLLVVLALFAGTACWPFDDDALAEMSLERQRGEVDVLRDGETLSVDSDFQLEPGDIIVTKKDTAAKLRLKGAREVELASDSQVEILSETSIEGQGGALLASATDSMSVAFGDVKATAARSIFRVDQGFGSTRVGAYEGTFEISAPGERVLLVDQYHEAQVAAGDVPGLSEPYRLDVSDPWDRKFFPQLVSLEEELDHLGSSFALQIGKERPTLRDFQALAGRKNVDFVRPYLKGTPVTDLVIAFSIALLSDDRLEDAFKDAMDHFEDGAAWAIVAVLLDVSPKPLIAQLEDVFLASGGVAQGENEGLNLAASASAGDQPQGTTQPPSDDPSDPDPPKEGGAGPKPRPTPTGEPNDCSGTIDCVVKDVTDPEPEPSPSPTDLFDSLAGS